MRQQLSGVEDNVHRLIYFSAFSASFPVTHAEQDIEIGNILRSSIRNNGALNVTGLLVAYRGWFLQVLEGPQDAVQSIYDCVVADPRNDNIRLIFFDAVETRKFPDWGMSACRLSKVDDAILKVLDMREPFTPHNFTPAMAVDLLLAIQKIKSRISEPNWEIHWVN